MWGVGLPFEECKSHYVFRTLVKVLTMMSQILCCVFTPSLMGVVEPKIFYSGTFEQNSRRTRKAVLPTNRVKDMSATAVFPPGVFAA